MPGRSTSRRALLRGALFGASAAALTPALAACGSVAGAVSSDADIQFWHLFSGADGALMQNMIADVEKRVPELRPRSTVLEWGAAYYTKLAMASAGGRAPDVAVMHVSRLAGYAPGGLLDPWDLDLLAEFGVARDELNPKVSALGRYDDKPFAIPLDTHPFVVFYDRDVMDKSGLLDSQGKLIPLENPENFLEAAAKLRKDTGKLGPVVGVFSDTAQAWRLFWGFYSQTGGPFDLSEKKPRVDEDKMAKVIDFIKKLTAPDCRTMDYPAAIAAFTTRRSPFVFSGEWESATYRGSGIDLGAAPLPTLFGRPATQADSHTFVLPHQDDPDPARRRGAHRLVAEILTSSLTWAKAGHVPAYLPVVESKAYAALDPQASYAPAADHPALDPQAWFTGSGSDFQARMCQALQSAINGSASTGSTVKKMLSEIDFFLSKPNPA
ncbi:extracellular solute-binding protein [Streptomyces tsukubensis]|uniref:ABC transporter substrate-binding protein n=1 Tax=Streptomyces tsukubensis TaxID=83656 RepID=A0A1V4AFU8_9ACTN|nr:extracellular solute-binding protein [Streptomyces tsukubensis]OON82899.1 ABC transporter substrate-binding protein [Streptomyces tsukubensis]QFR91917.1 extracellular solute-binding protein [Streptomyces tsukubensis]